MSAATIDERTGEVWQPVPAYDGRAELVATLVHTREDLSEFGPVLKGLFLVERPDGSGRFKLWGTVPRGLTTAERTRPHGATLSGSLVAFSALVERSARDECFGFFKRPTKAEVLTWGQNGRPIA